MIVAMDAASSAAATCFITSATFWCILQVTTQNAVNWIDQQNACRPI